VELIAHADDAVKKALGAGAQAGEAFAMTYRTKSVYIEQDVPKVAEDRTEAGIGIKVAVGKRVAFTSASLEGSKDVRTATATAMKAVKMVPEDPDFPGFTSFRATGEVEKTHDAKTADAPIEELVEMALDLTKASNVRKDVTVPKGILRVQDFNLRVANSEGAEGSHRGTLVFLYFTAKSGTKTRAGEGIVKSLGVSLSQQDFQGIGKRLGKRSLENLEATALREKISGTVVMDPIDLGEMLIQSVGVAVNAEEVRRKRSPWQDKKGEKVASEGLSIADMPHLPAGLSSCAVDDEGGPTADRSLVRNGTLRGFVHDHYNAVLLGGKGGNAFRRAVGTVEGAYARPAQCSISNLVVEPGTQSLEDIVGSIKEGVYVEKLAAPEVNPYSGAFALEVRNAAIIDKGELGDHVKYALLVGNIFDGLKNVVATGRELHPTHGFLTAAGCCYLPPMAFDGFELVGRK
jgi:predicted Zn-dependent protease